MIADLSDQECTTLCDERGFRFAGREGQLCFCSNFYDPETKAASSSLCDSPCTLPSACGNKTYIRIFDAQNSMRRLQVTGPNAGLLMKEVSFKITVDKGEFLGDGL